MHKTELATLIINGPLSVQKWKKLIEARVQMISSHLDTATLKTMGDLRCPRYCTSEHGPYHHRLGEHYWSTASKFDRKTRGVFVLDSSKAEVARAGRSGTMPLWGLTRSKEFVHADIVYSIKECENHELWWNLEPISVRPSTFEELIASPQRILFWDEIGSTVGWWSECAKNRYDTMAEMRESLEFEDLLVRARVE